PLIGVTVMIKGTTTANSSDVQGNYQITSPADATLVFTYIGYDTQEIQVNGKTTISVQLVPNSTGLEEVVVVGYGTTKKASLTGSITAVKGEVLQQSSSPNVSNSLAGRLPGLTAVTTTGEPGNDGSMLRIRGSNT